MIIELSEHEARDGVELSAAQAGLLARTGAVVVRPSTRADGTWLVEARQHVGVVRAGAIELRVRPKVPVRRLFEMILETWDIRWRPDIVSAADAPDVTRAIVSAFLARTEDALRRGPLVGYVTRDEDSMTLRGRLRLSSQLARHPGMPVPLAVRYDELSTDVLANRLVRSAAFRLSFLPGLAGAERVALARIEAVLAEAAPLKPGEPFTVPVLRRDQTHYGDALCLAVLVLRHLSIDARIGQINGLSFLLDMNRLFQEWVTKRLGEPARRAGLAVNAEWKVLLDASAELGGRADVVLTKAGKPVLVLDVKYKRGPTPADRYQALAYCRALGLGEAHLVRPGSAATTSWDMLPDRVRLVEHELDLLGSSAALDERFEQVVGWCSRGPTAGVDRMGGVG